MNLICKSFVISKSSYAIDLTALQSSVFIETIANCDIWGEKNLFFLCAIPSSNDTSTGFFSDHWLVLLLISCRAVSHFILSCNHWILRRDSDLPSGARSIITLFIFTVFPCSPYRFAHCIEWNAIYILWVIGKRMTTKKKII